MKKPIVLVIMDGVGRGDGGPGDAVKQAKTPNLDRLFATCPYTWLKAHGTAVGLPSDEDMGNSEVGPQRARMRPDLRPGSQTGIGKHCIRRTVPVQNLEKAV